MERTWTNTITKADMVEHLVQQMGIKRVEAKQFIVAVFEEITEAVVRGEDVKLTDLGHFFVKNKKTRPGRNLKTQKSVPISARRVVTFRAGPKLKHLVNQSSS